MKISHIFHEDIFNNILCVVLFLGNVFTVIYLFKVNVKCKLVLCFIVLFNINSNQV